MLAELGVALDEQRQRLDAREVVRGDVGALELVPALKGRVVEELVRQLLRVLLGDVALLLIDAGVVDEDWPVSRAADIDRALDRWPSRCSISLKMAVRSSLEVQSPWSATIEPAPAPKSRP